MNSFILLVLGMILLNSVVQLIPLFYPNLDPGLYIPYQLWINILLIFNWLLPSRKGLYLFKKTDAIVVDTIPVDTTAPPANPTYREDVTPSAPPITDDSSPSPPPPYDSNTSDNNISGLTTELNPDGSFPPNYDIYASRAD